MRATWSVSRLPVRIFSSARAHTESFDARRAVSQQNMDDIAHSVRTAVTAAPLQTCGSQRPERPHNQDARGDQATALQAQLARRREQEAAAAPDHALGAAIKDRFSACWAADQKTRRIAVRGLQPFLEQLHEAGKPLGPVAYGVALGACVPSHSSRVAQNIVCLMKKHGVPMSTSSYNHLLLTLAKNSEAEAMLRAFEKMHAAGIPPNEVTYTALLDGVGRMKPGETGAIWAAMKAAGIRPDRALFVKYIRYSPTPRDAEARLAEAKDTLKKLDPDFLRVLYGSLITVAAAAGRVGFAKQAFEDLVAKEGVRPEVQQWTALMGAHATLGDVQSCLDVFRRMRDSGLTPTEQTYATLLRACEASVPPDVDVARSTFQTLPKELMRSRILHSWKLRVLAASGDEAALTDHLKKVRDHNIPTHLPEEKYMELLDKAKTKATRDARRRDARL